MVGKRWIERYRARSRYFAADRAAGDVLRALATTQDAPGRMLALYELAEQARVMSENAHGFRHARKRDEDGFTLADSCEWESWLVGLVADTEASLVFGDDGGLWYAPVLVSAEANVVLAHLSVEPRPVARGVLVLALYDAVVDQAGGQAAEVLPAIAAAYFELSGMSYGDAVRRAWGGASR